MTDNQQGSTRTCRKCGEDKPLELFALVYSTKNRGKNYRQHTCAVCARKKSAERMKKARADNPEKYRLHMQNHRKRNPEKCRKQRRESGQRLKDDVFAHYGGYVCLCCGETSQTMLTIDHVDGKGAEHRESLGGGRSSNRTSVDMYRWLKKNNYPSGFQVLCYNCNISKHRNGVCEHSSEPSETIPKGSRVKRPEKPSPLSKGEDIVQSVWRHTAVRNGGLTNSEVS